MLMTFAVVSFIACDDNDPVAPPMKDQIVGTWDVTSYKLSGDEYMGLIFEAASIEFEAYTDDEGQFTQEVTFFDEDSTAITGDYTFDEAEDKVTMEYDGDIIIATVSVTGGNKLHWNGTQDGFPLVIEATRRD